MSNMLEKLWDDVAGGSPPDRGLKHLRKSTSGQYPGGMTWTYSGDLYIVSVLFERGG